MTTDMLELGVYKLFEEGNYQALIPRVQRKFKIHECDIVVVTNDDYIYEIELKVSVSDCKRDREKEHQHKDLYNRLKYQYFALPSSIVDECIDFIPEHFGIIVINDETLEGSFIRKAEMNKKHRRISKGELINLLTTGCKRYFQKLDNIWKKEEDNDEETKKMKY